MTNRLLIIALVAALLGSANAQSFVTARVTGVQFQQGGLYDQTVASVTGSADQRIRITRIGIGGDADSQSGDALFRIVSQNGTTDFQYVAGQGDVNTGMSWYGVGTINHRLTGTPIYDGSARGFSVLDVDYLLEAGEGFNLNFRGTRDWDGRYTRDTDPLGNSFDDSAVASSIRGWVQYEMMPVPEPSLLLGLGLFVPAFLRRRRRQ